MTKRAVLYARVSGDDRGKDGRNLKGQLDMCREYALAQGYTILKELAEDDRGAPGADFNLEKLNQALEMARNGEFEVLIVRELDRFARSLAKQLIVETEFERAGVEIDYVLGEYPDTPEGNLMKNVRAVVAEYERLKIAERTTRARFNFVRRGNVLGHGKAPFGYKLAEKENKRTLAIYEPEAQTVRLIFGLYVHEGVSIRGIAKRLTNLGIPTANDLRGGYKLSEYAAWNPGALQHILSNETYAGIWYYGKSRFTNGAFVKNDPDHYVPVEVPAIVDRDAWEAAQERRAQNKLDARYRQKYHYLLTGHLVCGDCGLAMCGRTTKNGERLYQYYFCPVKQDHSPRKCSLPYFSASQVDTSIWNWLKQWLCDPKQLASGLEAYQTDQEQANVPIIERLKAVNDLLLSNGTQLERLLDLYLAGDFPQEILAERKVRLEQTIKSLKAEEATLEATLDVQQLTEEQIESIFAFVAVVREGLEEADDSFEAKRNLIELLDVRVTLAVENDEKIVYATCRLGKGSLSVASNTT